LLKIAGALSLLDGGASGDDAEQSKPDPDIVHAALKKTGASASDALMIGDTPYDIEAAARAGVRTIAFRSGGWNLRRSVGPAGAPRRVADRESQIPNPKSQG